MNKRKETKSAPAAVEEPASRKPIKTLVIEDVAASIFARQYPSRGELRTFYSVTFSRSYRDSAGVRKYVKTFDLEDLGKVVAVAQQADEYIRELMAPKSTSDAKK